MNMGVRDMSNDWKAYQYYCMLCTRSEITPLSFEDWKLLIQLAKES